MDDTVFYKTEDRIIGSGFDQLSDSLGFDEQETLHDVNIGDTVKVTYLGSNRPQKYKCNAKIEKGKKYYDNININIEVIR
ncbi:hypothetical protein HGO23_10025 [Xenorhabdus budapestensis]|uniref:Uncharacterized protein n=1 Tax=Xenorhabdus budapestensis TaxID=290110 RepID=A0ABX7VCK8_XENBU|nr:hypothetical protein [Xenorhabdus budapestensis]QTL38275.1 hypothetical protein HGO23_10025 [Xenorhabdus budapestensis]